MSAEYRNSIGGYNSAIFREAFQFEDDIAFIDGGLGARSESPLWGTVYIRKDRVAEVTDIRIWVDTCNFIETPPFYCSVNEVNENNNTLTIFDIDLDR